MIKAILRGGPYDGRKLSGSMSISDRIYVPSQAWKGDPKILTYERFDEVEDGLEVFRLVKSDG